MHTDTTIGSWPWTIKTSDDAEITPKRMWNKWKIHAGRPTQKYLYKHTHHNSTHGCTHTHLHDQQAIKHVRVYVRTYLILAPWWSVYEWRSSIAHCIWGHLPEESWHHCCRPSAESMGSASSHNHKQMVNLQQFSLWCLAKCGPWEFKMGFQHNEWINCLLPTRTGQVILQDKLN